MFFMILGTYRNQTFIDFSPAQRIQLMISLCHTVTHGTDLRRSPQGCRNCSLERHLDAMIGAMEHLTLALTKVGFSFPHTSIYVSNIGLNIYWT